MIGFYSEVFLLGFQLIMADFESIHSIIYAQVPKALGSCDHHREIRGHITLRDLEVATFKWVLNAQVDSRQTFEHIVLP